MEQPKGDSDLYAQDRMKDMYGLIERLTNWYDDVKRLDTDRLTSLLALGAKVTRFLETTDRIVALGRGRTSAKRSLSESDIRCPRTERLTAEDGEAAGGQQSSRRRQRRPAPSLLTRGHIFRRWPHFSGYRKRAFSLMPSADWPIQALIIPSITAREGYSLSVACATFLTVQARQSFRRCPSGALRATSQCRCGPCATVSA